MAWCWGRLPLSTIDALRIAYSKHPEGFRKSVFKPLLETQDKTITTALGKTYTFDELYNAAGNLGVFGQPGMMDIEKKLEFSDRTDVLAKTLKSASKIDPANVARSEENVMRLSMFVDRVKRGDTLDDAARYATKYMFDYLPESKTQFQRNVLARSFPISEILGNNKMTICPFHNDVIPSLSIDHERGLWHCFACNRSGNVIQLIMRLEGLNFKAAVRKLAR